MGDSFRLGTPQEDTSLKTDGLFSLSRNPMYVGVYATIVASCLYTLNPVVILLGAFVVAVHHSILLAEENHIKRYSAANMWSIAAVYGGTSDVPGQNDGGFRDLQKLFRVRIGKK